MQFDSCSLDVKLAVDIGDAKLVRDFVEKTIHVQAVGTPFVATLQFEASIDGSEWTTVAIMTGPGIVRVADPWYWLRVNTTIYTSGSPACVLAYRDSRTS